MPLNPNHPSIHPSSIVTLVLSGIFPSFRDIRAFVRRKPLFPYPTPIPTKLLGCSPWSRSVTLGCATSERPSLSLLIVKLFLTISNVCDQEDTGASTSRADRQTTRRSNTALCVALRGKNQSSIVGTRSQLYRPMKFATSIPIKTATSKKPNCR